MMNDISALNLSAADWVAIERLTYQENFYLFVKAAWHILEPHRAFIENWHMEALCKHLEAVGKGEITRLAISIPPGHAKSLMVSVMFNAWMWTHSPHKRFISTSSSELFCERDNQKLRDLVKSNWYQARWPIDFPTVDTVIRFENDSRGFRLAKSFLSLTGVRGNFLIIDDVLPVDMANSEIERNKVNRRFFEQASSRLEDFEEDAIIIIAQRIHSSDLIGEIIERQNKGEDLGFTFLNIPMEYDGGDTPTSIGWVDPRTAFGELICPAYRSQKAVEREKITLGFYAYSAQYNQQPVPRSNGFFKKDDFVLYDPLVDTPKELNYYILSDSALGLSNRSDYNVVRVFGVDSNKHFWMVDSFRERCSINKALGIETSGGKISLLSVGVLPFIKKYKPLMWIADSDAIIKANLALIKDSMIATNTMCRIEIAGQSNTKKIERASAYQAMSQLNMIHLPDNDIGHAAIAEYVAFPVGRNNDQVDCDGLLARYKSHPAFVTPIETKREDDYTGSGNSDAQSDAYDAF
jgi:phage terminase large subunit-like protein